MNKEKIEKLQNILCGSMQYEFNNGTMTLTDYYSGEQVKFDLLSFLNDADDDTLEVVSKYLDRNDDDDEEDY